MTPTVSSTEGLYYDYPLFEADEDLFWRPIANTHFTDANGLRLPGPASEEKTPMLYRIAVLGDSCSFLGIDLFPNHLASLIQAHRGRAVDVVNASSPGYTSFQGLRRLSTLWKWKPDLVIVNFGWNDHWKALSGCTDRELADRRRFLIQPKTWLQDTRIFGTMGQLVSLIVPPAVCNPERPASVRVTLDQYGRI